MERREDGNQCRVEREAQYCRQGGCHHGQPDTGHHWTIEEAKTDSCAALWGKRTDIVFRAAADVEVSWQACFSRQAVTDPKNLTALGQIYRMDDQRREIVELLDEIQAMTHACLTQAKQNLETLISINQTSKTMLADRERYRRERRELELQRSRIESQHEIDADPEQSH